MYYPKRVLITGVAGFIPANVTCYLVEKYPQIMFVGIDKLSYCSDIRNLSEIEAAANFSFVKLDICDQEKLEELWERHSFDTVIHMAAYSHIDYSLLRPLKFTTNNVLGTHILLEVARDMKVQRFIYVSTDEVYGNQETVSDETSPLRPTNPYSATKAAADLIVQSYITSYNFPAIITRGNNVYGPKQYPEKVIPRFILRLLKGDKCQIQGSGQQTRSFLFTEDAAKAFDVILHYGVSGEIYNIGSKEEYSIIDLATKLCQALGKETTLEHVKDRNFNDQHYRIDCSKLQRLGWEQQVSLEQGLSETIEWYRQHQDWYHVK